MCLRPRIYLDLWLPDPKSWSFCAFGVTVDYISYIVHANDVPTITVYTTYFNAQKCSNNQMQHPSQCIELLIIYKQLDTLAGMLHLVLLLRRVGTPLSACFRVLLKDMWTAKWNDVKRWSILCGQCHPGRCHGPTLTATPVVQAGDGVYSARRSAGARAGCCRCPAASSTPWTVSSDQRPRPSASSASPVSALASRNFVMTSRLIQVYFRSIKSLLCYRIT